MNTVSIGTVLCGMLFGATLLYPTPLKQTWHMIAYDVEIYVSRSKNICIRRQCTVLIRNYMVHGG